eukprot:scaffold99151_cov66-Phaeocystis_antarctica.AAC.1
MRLATPSSTTPSSAKSGTLMPRSSGSETRRLAPKVVGAALERLRPPPRTTEFPAVQPREVSMQDAWS